MLRRVYSKVYSVLYVICVIVFLDQVTIRRAGDWTAELHVLGFRDDGQGARRGEVRR